MTICLYAITDRPQMPLPAQLGLGDAALAPIVWHDIGAVISSHDDEPPPASADALWRYEAVIEALMERRTVLPVRYGTMMPTERTVTDMLRRDYAQFTDDIARVQGHVEIGVRFVPLAVGAEDMRAAPKESVATSGTAYLMTKVAQVQDCERRRAAATETARTMYAILKHLATASRFDAETADRDWIAAAFLMPRDATETFQQAVDRLAMAHPKLALLCTGPWPPYSFVGAWAGEKAIGEDDHGYLH